ncbi:MAG: 5-oxoprolinase subunit PxpB [Bacteroidota bacterium]
MKAVQVKPFGDRAVMLVFKAVLDPAINQQVHALWRFLQNKSIPGLTYGIPSNHDLTLVFKSPDHASQAFIQLSELTQNFSDHPVEESGKNIRIPVCYEPEFGLDLYALSTQFQLSIPEIIAAHSSTSYHVFSMGFLPGFAYLGSLPKQLQIGRKAQPRALVPAGSVAIAAGQTGIYPQDTPGGWHIIGRTPIPIFDPSEAEPFLFAPGDRVQFKSISISSFREMVDRVNHGQFNWQSCYV